MFTGSFSCDMLSMRGMSACTHDQHIAPDSHSEECTLLILQLHLSVPPDHRQHTNTAGCQLP